MKILYKSKNEKKHSISRLGNILHLLFYILPEYRNLSAYNDAESKSFMSLLPSYELINEPAVSVWRLREIAIPSHKTYIDSVKISSSPNLLRLSSYSNILPFIIINQNNKGTQPPPSLPSWLELNLHLHYWIDTLNLKENLP